MRGLAGSPAYAGDIALGLDGDGVIRSVRVGRQLAGEVPSDAFRGRRWVDLVAAETREKAERLFEEALSGGVTGFREIELLLPRGGSVPVEFAAVRDEISDRVLLLGRDLRGMVELQRRFVEAQQSLERDYWKLRAVETRYRLIFRESSEAGLVLDGKTLSVLDANPAAMRFLGIDRAPSLATLLGRTITADVALEDRERLQAFATRVLEQGEAPPIEVTLGPERIRTLVRASAARQADGTALFLRLTEWDDERGGPKLPTEAIQLRPLVDLLPDSFVICDRQGAMLYANGAFADLVQASPGRIPGRTLTEWLARPGADWTVIRASIERHGSVRLFPTRVVGDLGLETEVEISASGVGTPSQDALVGLLIRDVSRRIPSDRKAESFQFDEAELGRKTLARAVSEATETVERHFIGAALDVTSGNRTAAARLLGVSRQSLYSKLERYGIDDPA